MKPTQTRLVAGCAVVAAVLLILTAATCPLAAQSFFGSIVGTVTDATGSVIPNASVTLTNLGTSERKTAQTDDNGNYQFVSLVPGTYRVDVEIAGFKRLSRDQVAVRVDTATRVDAKMEVGEVTQTVEVSAQAALLQTESATVSQIVEGRQVQDMPLNGRNVLNLIALAPGVVPQSSTEGNPFGNQGGGARTNGAGFGNYQIGGGMSNQGASYIDGAPNNWPMNNGVVIVPTQDAIQEFNVATNNVSAEFGGFSGGVINMTTKSGTNQFHGSVYEYLRNRVLNANDFFNNSSGIPRNSFSQNQYGANVGGPVVKNKAFFHFVWEGFALRRGIPTTITVPTAAARSGVYTGLATVYDPLSTVKGADGKVTRTPFPDNVLPADRIDATAKAMLLFWTLPNKPGNTNNYSYNNPRGGNTNQYTGRLDYSLSDRQRLFARYTYWGMRSVTVDWFQNKTGGAPQPILTHQVVLGDTYTLTPTTFADLRVAFNRVDQDQTPQHIGIDMSMFGPAWGALAKSMSYTGYPAITISGGYAAQNVVLQRSISNEWSFTGSVTKMIGRHTLKAGGQTRRGAWDFLSVLDPTGSFSYDYTFTSATGTNTPSSGHAFASFLLGYPTTGTIGTVRTPKQQLNSLGLYVADTFQVTSKLTLNVGLRWDQPGAFKEKSDYNTVLLPDAVSPLASKTGLPLKGAVALVNSPQWTHREELLLNWKQFSPRIGLAYRATARLVVRAGYGINRLPGSIAQLGPNLSPLNYSQTTMVTTLDGGLTPNAKISNPFPNGIASPAGRNTAYVDSLAGRIIIAQQPKQPSSYVQQWNLNIQRELGSGLMAQVGYVGAKGTHLPFVIANGANVYNQLPTQYFSMGSALLTQVANPFYGVIPESSILGQKTVAQGYLLRPYSQFLVLGNPQNNAGDSIYHALQTSFQKRFAAGGTVSANYTWAKFISNTDTATNFLDAVGGPQDWTNLKAERSLVSQDVPHRFVVSYLYDLPVGRGKAILGGANGVLDKLVSGWSFNGVTTLRAGFPIPMTTLDNSLAQFGVGASSIAGRFGYFMRPNVVAACGAVLSGPAQSRLGKWFDTACYQQPGQFAMGNASRTDPKVRAHGQNNFDFSVNKKIALKEGVNLGFHTEIFNVFNRVMFAAPARQAGNANFGRVTAAANNPRLVQLALRLTF